MKYFEYIAFLLFFLSSIAFSYWFYVRMTRDQYLRLVLKRFIRRQKDLTGEKFFSTWTLAKITTLLLKQKKQTALSQLLDGDTKAAEKYLKKKKLPLAASLLLAYENPSEAAKQLENIIKKQPQNYAALAHLAELYFTLGQKAKATHALSLIDEKKADRYTRALTYYYQAAEELYNGAMQEASLTASRSIGLFTKEKAQYEEAKAYLLLGTIYRVSAVEDMAQFMFADALKIFAQIGAEDGIADAKGNLGMLMIMQNRFADADAYFNEALEINQQINRQLGSAEITNQLALSALLQQDEKRAAKLAQKALKEHQKFANLAGQAFSLDILSYIHQQEKNFAEVIKVSAKALKIHQQQKDLSACMECMYLQASAYFEQKEFEKAEEFLRKIINQLKGKSSHFHIANVYNMLGLIFLQKGDLRRAKGWFYQSLDQEQKNDRFSGAATDFANIALVELRCGHLEQARKTLETALEYASAYGENELCESLRKELKKLTSHI